MLIILNHSARDPVFGGKVTDRYVTGLFEACDGIESRKTSSRPIPAEFGVEGYFFRYEHHFIYWRRLSKGDVVLTQ